MLNEMQVNDSEWSFKHTKQNEFCVYNTNHSLLFMMKKWI